MVTKSLFHSMMTSPVQQAQGTMSHPLPSPPPPSPITVSSCIICCAVSDEPAEEGRVVEGEGEEGGMTSDLDGSTAGQPIGQPERGGMVERPQLSQQGGQNGGPEGTPLRTAPISCMELLQHCSQKAVSQG